MMGKETYLQAVERVLKGWQALRMAVDNSFGGADSVEKAEWMVEVTGEFVWDNWPGKLTVKKKYSTVWPFKCNAAKAETLFVRV